MMTEPFKIKMQFLIGEIRNTGTRTVCAAIFVNSIKSLMCSGRNFSLGILNFQISIFSEEQFLYCSVMNGHCIFCFSYIKLFYRW